MHTDLLKTVRQIVPICAAVTLFSAPTSQAQDYMGMAEMYGQNVVINLGDDIRASGIKQSMGLNKGDSRTTVWPRHITEASVSSHVFSIDELDAMRHSDQARMERMVSGKQITVQGIVQRQARADSSFLLTGSQPGGYGVWAHWRGRVTLPDEGSVVALRGVADTKRRTRLNLTNPEFVTVARQHNTAQNSVGPAQTSADIRPQSNSSAPDYDALKFRTSNMVTAALAEKMADALAPSLSAGYSRDDIVKLVRSGELQKTFSGLLKPYGFSDRDLGDVLASHLIMSWQIANNQPEDGPRSGVLAVRKEVRDALAQAGWVSSLSNAQKQEFAEMLSVSTMLIAARYLNGVEAGNQAMISMAAKDAQDMVNGYGGVDLKSLTLTEMGFVPR